MKLLSTLAIVVLSLTACYGPDANVTGSGKGRPYITVEFPAEVDGGSTQTAIVEIENPGPGAMRSVLVAFSLVGQPAAEGGVPPAIVPTGFGGKNASIISVDPEPLGVSQDGIVFRFGPIAEGDAVTIEFEIKVPTERGQAANAVIVSDGDEIDRARGVRMSTTIR